MTGRKLQHFRRQVEDLDTFLPDALDDGRQLTVVSDLAVRRQSDDNELAPLSSQATVQAGEKRDADIFAVAVDPLDRRKSSPPPWDGPAQHKIREVAVAERVAQGGKTQRRQFL